MQLRCDIFVVIVYASTYGNEDSKMNFEIECSSALSFLCLLFVSVVTFAVSFVLILFLKFLMCCFLVFIVVIVQGYDKKVPS